LDIVWHYSYKVDKQVGYRASGAGAQNLKRRYKMTIQVITQEEHAYDLLSAQVIHRDNSLLIIAMPTEFLPVGDDKKFWAEEPVIVSLTEDLKFEADAWFCTHEVGAVAIIQYCVAVEKGEETGKKALFFKSSLERATELF